jgi:hypothetical protein
MKDELRTHIRAEWVAAGTIYTGDGAGGRPCMVRNLSDGGAKITDIAADNMPDEFMLTLTPKRGPSRKCEVVWRRKHEMGVRFIEPFPALDQPGKNNRAKKKDRAPMGVLAE